MSSPLGGSHAGKGSQPGAERILGSVFSNWMSLGASLIASFFLFPFLVHRLGSTEYEIWALVLQLTGYMGVVDVGVRSALIRYVARYHAEGDQKALDEMLRITMILYSVIALLAVGALLAIFLLPLLNIPARLLHQSRIVLMLAAMTLAVGLPLGTFQAVLAGLFRYDLLNAIETTSIMVRTLLIVPFVYAGHGLVAIAAITDGAHHFKFVGIEAHPPNAVSAQEIIRAGIGLRNYSGGPPPRFHFRPGLRSR